MATSERSMLSINRADMTKVMTNSEEPAVDNSLFTGEGDISPDEIEGTGISVPPVSGGTGAGGGGNFGVSEGYPIVIPNSPTFTVPANPLLPEGYNEVLDYNAVQYLNGIFRTQIGRYVRVEMLMGSSMLEDYEGFLIGVGINYIILQEYANSNIRILDIYGVKSMYVYYTDISNTYSGPPIMPGE